MSQYRHLEKAFAYLVSGMLSVGCVPTNDLVPLRGEDPEALALSAERADWLHNTGATRSFERFQAALRRGDYEEVLKWLGPVTRKILEREALNSGVSVTELLARGDVAGLSLPGSSRPLYDLRLLGPGVRATEDRPFDPTRTRVVVVLQRPDGLEPILVPALCSDDGWRFEMVQVIPEAEGTKASLRTSEGGEER